MGGRLKPADRRSLEFDHGTEWDCVADAFFGTQGTLLEMPNGCTCWTLPNDLLKKVAPPAGEGVWDVLI